MIASNVDTMKSADMDLEQTPFLGQSSVSDRSSSHGTRGSGIHNYGTTTGNVGFGSPSKTGNTSFGSPVKAADRSSPAKVCAVAGSGGCSSSVTGSGGCSSSSKASCSHSMKPCGARMGVPKSQSSPGSVMFAVQQGDTASNRQDEGSGSNARNSEASRDVTDRRDTPADVTATVATPTSAMATTVVVNVPVRELQMEHALVESVRRRESSGYNVIPWEPGPGDRPMYDGPDMPSTDLPEDHSGPEPQQIPLDVSRLPKVKGYEHVGYHSHSGLVVQWVRAGDKDCWLGCRAQGHWVDSLKADAPAIPPPFDHIPHIDKCKQPEEEQYSSVSHINETQARESLLHYAAEKCCYGSSAAKDMVIHKITPTSALHYTLETYTETRTTSWEQEPYKGQTVDGPENGMAPPPWDIHCNPTQMFHDEVHCLEVPHTASVIACHGCASLGWVRCHSCMGRGFKRCMYCHGTGRIWKTDAHGHRHTESCWHCHGTGRKRCRSCGGDGRVVCRTCNGFRQLKCFIKLTVTYTNHDIERIVEHTKMPELLVKDVTGEVVYEQTQPRVWAIAHYPDLEMCRSSQRMVSEQQNCYPDSRIIMQRHRLIAVPVSVCEFNYRDKEGRFWVYGKENAVYAPDYPQKCCWGCVIL